MRAGIALEPEVSFQGGDGYLFFATPELALATLTRIAELRPSETDPDAPTDPFYRRTDLSLDFYRAIKDHQHQHLESRTYARAITAFGLGMLNPTGSRVSRRQSDISADREMSLRQIRAIPHNAMLQQLGYPVNVICGVGTAADGNYEEIAALLNETASAGARSSAWSARPMRSPASRRVAAYGELFNSAYWASRPYRGTERHLSDACEALGRISGAGRPGRRVPPARQPPAGSMRLKLHRLLDADPRRKLRSPSASRSAARSACCQALRLALFQHMFIRAVSIPVFSRANDISRDDVLEMVLHPADRRSARATAPRLSRPASPSSAISRSARRPTTPKAATTATRSIRRAFIDPIERAYRL